MRVLLICILTGAVSVGAVTVSIEGNPPFPRADELGIDEIVPSDSSVGYVQEEVLEWYLNEGYPFAAVSCFFPTPDSLVIHTVPGRHAGLERVVFVTDDTLFTQPEVLTRYLEMNPGDPWSPVAVEEWQSELERLPFIESIGITELYFGEMGNLVLMQHITEDSPGSFMASFGYDGNRVTGEGEIDIVNLLGTGRELEISGSSVAWGGFDAAFRYRESWLFDIPLSVELRLEQTTPESAWVNREGQISLILTRRILDLSIGAGIHLGYPPDTDRQKYTYGLAGIRINPGRRVVQGWEGVDIYLESKTGRSEDADSAGTLSIAKATIDGHWFKGVIGLGGDILTGGIISGNWYDGILVRFGGQTTLRGYSDDVFTAIRYLIVRPEISFGETSTRIYLFTDLGALETPTEICYPFGCGIGIRGDTGILFIDLSAGFPLDEGLSSARLYLTAKAGL